MSTTSRKGRARLHAAFATGASVAVLALSAPAQAQNEPQPVIPGEETPAPAAAGEAGSNTILVTGSRIARRDYTATSPIVTVDAALLEQSSSINLEANLNKLPQLAPALTQFGPPEGRGDINSTATNTPGATTVSLRQLGANRNLVLVDGRRQTPVNGTGVVDINSIPSAAIERVEIITGGASSTYGADAVGGVVNFILKSDFEGVTLDGQYGITERGDGAEYRVSGLVGASTGDGRGNVMLGMERYEREQIRQFSRPWYVDLYSSPDTLGNTIFGFEQTYFLFPTQAGRPATSGNPSQATLNTMFRAKGAPATSPNGAVLNVPTTASFYLNTDNTLFLNQANGTGSNYVPLLAGYTGTVDGVSRKLTSGGLLRDNYIDQMMSTPMDRWSFFAKGNYEFNDWVGVFGQANFVRSRVFTRNLVAPAITSWSVLIPHGTDVFLGDYTLNNSPGADGLYQTPDDVPLVGAVNLGIPSSRLANGNTHPDYLAGGRFGLNCPAVGGCTNNQVYPTPGELNTLLNSRASPNSPFQINKFLNELEERLLDNRTTNFQVLAGLEGTIPGTDFTWEVYGAHGESTTKTDQYNFASVLRWRAVLSSPNYGQGFTFKGNSGTPGGGFQGATGRCTSGVNPFTRVAWTDDCANAVRTNLQTENKNTQDTVEANIQGGLFDLPYGQLRFAAGASYRKNTIDFHPDGQSTEGTSFLEPVNGIYPQGATSGSITAKEVYGEVLIPILSGLPFAEELNIEAGYRLSDYDIQSVGTVGTYKINGEWAPFEWLRFRGGYQRASRAPNLAELFTAATSTLGTSSDGDPCSRANPANPVGIGNYSANPIGQNSELQPIASDTNGGNADSAKVEALCRQIMNADGNNGAATYYAANRAYSAVTAGLGFPTLIGNPNLEQEDATTYTIGGMIRSPSNSPWLSRLNLSVDYYNIDLTNAISQQGIDGVYRRCFARQYNPTYELNDFCRLVGRTPGTGEVANVSITYSNAGRVKTSGVDAQLNWALDLEEIGTGLPGSFITSVQTSYLLNFETTTDEGIIPLVDFVGTTGSGQVGTNAGSYRFKAFTTFTYAVSGATVSLQWQYKSAVDSMQSVLDTASNITGFPAYSLFNLNGTYAVTPDVQFRWGIDNLFDKAPPLGGVNLNADGRATLRGGVFDPAQYDVIGRRFFIGATFDF
jgi:iron complex outermembrane recepter protein